MIFFERNYAIMLKKNIYIYIKKFIKFYLGCNKFFNRRMKFFHSDRNQFSKIRRSNNNFLLAIMSRE